MVNSTFFTDTEINDEINASLKRLHNKLAQTFEDEYFHGSSTFASVADQKDYALPADFFKLLGVDVKRTSDNRWFSVHKFAFQERNTRNFTAFGLLDYRYRLRGDNIHLIPEPQTGLTFQIHYIPTFTPLATDGATFDGINGWEEWAVIDAAMKMLRAEETDTAELQVDLQRIESEIEAVAANRDAGEPEQVVDLRSIDLSEYAHRRFR